MTKLIEKYFDLAELTNFALEKKLNEEFTSEFFRFIENQIKDAESCNLDNLDIKDEIVEGMLTVVADYIKIYKQKREEGYSVHFSRGFAHYFWQGENHNASFANGYDLSRMFNKDHSLNDLKIYCKSLNAEELFTKYFIFLMEKMEGHENPWAGEQAENYLKYYKKQISIGKSEIFANKYADEKAIAKCSEIYCYAVAAEYERALNNGHSEIEASYLALHLAEYIENYYSSYQESIDEVLVNMKREELIRKIQKKK